MVNRRASEAAPPPAPAAPVVKRKRRASCLGEQERRERKRAIDREAQRSLREKTKTHIAELERTIQILRDQDRNGATASLLSEIDVLRAENDRLRDVIESVRSVVGGDLLSRNTAPVASGNGGGGANSPAASSVEHQSPRPRTMSFTKDAKPDLSTPLDKPNPFEFHRSPNRPLDLDGMNIMMEMNDPAPQNSSLRMSMDVAIVTESSEENVEDMEELPWGNAPATASWEPMMEEIFGPNWRCPSPVILHIGAPDPPCKSAYVCPKWRLTNELYNRIFHHGLGAGALVARKSETAESGLLYLAIKQGWNTVSNELMQSPALKILKQVDQQIFHHLPNMERLALAYKGYKLLKYYLNATTEELEKVPEWLRPNLSQISIEHPVAIDFFAWPTLRDRLIQNHSTIFSTSELSHCYSEYVRFEWPFAFEDSFFHDPSTGAHYPSPLFEHYHNSLKNWTVDSRFYDLLPEIVGDIETDRRRFAEVEMG